MTKQGRVVALTSMTLLLYGLNTFFQTGTLVFPFPLNELFFIIAAIIIATLSFKEDIKLSVIGVVIGLFGVLSQEFYWSLVLSAEKMQVFSNGITKDLFLIGYYLSVLVWILFIFNKSRFNKSYFILISLILVYLFSILYEVKIVELLVYISITVLIVKELNRFPVMNLWILHLVLFIAKYWTLRFFN
jgi:hypothetical protein